MTCLSILDLFNSKDKVGLKTIIDSTRMQRVSYDCNSLSPSTELIIDTFPNLDTQCCFFRRQCQQSDTVELELSGCFHFASIAAGGWLLTPIHSSDYCFWIPQSAIFRTLDHHGRILKEFSALPSSININASSTSVRFTDLTDFDFLDLTIWKIPLTNTNILNSLRNPQAIEQQRYYLWSSHTNYQQLSDVFKHLIHGQLYENHTVWPHYWKICSELDAHALYVILRGLELACGSAFYALLKDQILFSIINRQNKDGGWYHGEWTDLMESHYRLHCGGMHLLIDALHESKDPIVEKSLVKAASFIFHKRDETAIGTWFCHDSLEQDQDSLNKSPFTWIKSNAFGKKPSNLFVLNTHLDTTIALERYKRITGDTQYDHQIQSARKTTTKVLTQQPANWLYKPIFWAVDLTFLPAKKASKLPMLVRALKRITWKYVIPRLFKLKSIYPRFVMPNGYIDRDLGLKNLSDPYLSVNMWDLLRHQLYFVGDDHSAVIEKGLSYIYNCGILDKWAEMTGKQHSLVFWAEALYQRCLVNSDLKYRQWLAETILLLEEKGLGLPPSSLGCYGETVPAHSQQPCHSTESKNIRIVNLSNDENIEFIFINSTNEELNFKVDNKYSSILNCYKSEQTPFTHSGAVIIPAKSWLIGYQST